MKSEIVVAWHGSPREFESFDYAKLRDDLGAFFAKKRDHAERYGKAQKYRLTFRNLLRVRQGQEYAKKVAMREGEKSGWDVRRRLMRDGYDGIRIEYDGGAVDYVAFSNRNIMPIGRQDAIQCVANRNDSSNSLRNA